MNEEARDSSHAEPSLPAIPPRSAGHMQTAEEQVKRLSVVCPAYNEEDNVEPFFEALRGVVDGDLNDYAAEFIFVDDGSLDETLSRLRRLAQADERVKVVALSRNFGHQAALTAGLRQASGDAVVTMDCDLQDPPEVVPRMVAKWREGVDIVYARRTSRVDTRFKRVTADLYYRLLAQASDVEIPRKVGDFRLLDKSVLKSLVRLGEHAQYLRGMVAWLGFKHDFVDFERSGRLHGETHYSLSRMMRLAMDGFLNFTLFPLKIGLWIGLLSMLACALFLTYMVGDTLINDEVYPLFKWLTVVLLGFMGAQFTFMWILGEYIGRIYSDVRKRPLYVVKETINLPTN